MSRLRRFEAAGTPAAMGESFGEQFRQEVPALVQSRMDHLAKYVAKHDPGRNVSREQMLESARRTVGAHRDFDAAIWEEFAGIARGAGVTVEELLIGNGLTDFRDYVLLEAGSAGAGGNRGECSAFLAPAGRTAGQPIVGQTWDMYADAQDFVLVVHRRPAGAPETLGVTTVGCLCLVGMNSEGVSVGNTNLAPTDAQAGVNYLFTITRALGCGSAAAAADAVEAAPRLSGHNFYIADGRAAIILETTATRSCRMEVTDEVFVLTNHYLTETLRPMELAGQDLASSRWRYRRLVDNFAGLSGTIAMDDCWRQLADNTRGDGAICNEDFDGEFGDFATLATVVQCPGRGELQVCLGGAKKGTREVLTL